MARRGKTNHLGPSWANASDTLSIKLRLCAIYDIFVGQGRVAFTLSK